VSAQLILLLAANLCGSVSANHADSIANMITS